MSLAPFYEAGYCPIPLRAGRPAVAGILVNNPSWRYAHGADERLFADCDVGVLCSSKPLSGASGPATLGAVSSTWIAGIRWESNDRKLASEIGAIIEQIAGPGPTRFEGAETVRIFKVAQPLAVRRLAPHYFPKEPHTDGSYRPHRLEVLSMASWVKVSGGRWVGGSLPEVRREQLPTLTLAQADAIVTGVQEIFNQRGALPWI
jgi:hypothetical protein